MGCGKGRARRDVDGSRRLCSRSRCHGFSPNGEKLACAASDVIEVYDVHSGKLVLGPIKGHENWINCVFWSLDGSQLFSASDDRTIRCWNSKSGESIGKPWTGHTNYVWSLSLSPDGTKLVSSSYDQTIRYWDARSGEPIERPLQHEKVLSAVAFSIRKFPLLLWSLSWHLVGT
ncbi:WD40 repeat-like protein [Paxillus ammoniavirescens]|nr:WD40 repeat-like protein [Paxillus ammoniavirescens]